MWERECLCTTRVEGLPEKNMNAPTGLYQRCLLGTGKAQEELGKCVSPVRQVLGVIRSDMFQEGIRSLDAPTNVSAGRMNAQ